MFRHSTTFAMVTAALSALAQEPQLCEFISGHSTVNSAPGQPDKLKPDWFVKQGRAELKVGSSTLTAKLFSTDLSGQQSHQLEAKLAKSVGKRMPFETRVSGTLKNLFSDAGDDALAGSFGITSDPSGIGKPLLRSLVLQNSYSFAAITCYGPGAA
jgi:hypothetical protein